MSVEPEIPYFKASDPPGGVRPGAEPTPTDIRRGSWATVAPYDPRAAMKYCEFVALGLSAEEIGHRLPFPDAGTFLIWVAQHPELAIAYRSSRELSSFSMEDEALALSRRAVRDGRTAQQLRAEENLVGQLRWSATKRNPGVFSDKAAVQLVVPIQINTTLDLGGDPATGGNIEFPNIYEMQAEVLREMPVEDIPDEHIFGVQPGDVGPAPGGKGPGAAGPAGKGKAGKGAAARGTAPAQVARAKGRRLPRAEAAVQEHSDVEPATGAKAPGAPQVAGAADPAGLVPAKQRVHAGVAEAKPGEGKGVDGSEGRGKAQAVGRHQGGAGEGVSGK